MTRQEPRAAGGLPGEHRLPRQASSAVGGDGRSSLLQELAASGTDFANTGTKQAHSRFLAAIREWRAYGKAPGHRDQGHRDLAVAVSRFEEEMDRRESLDAVRVAAGRVAAEAATTMRLRTSTAPENSVLTRRRTTLAVIGLVAALVLVAFLTLPDNGTDAGPDEGAEGAPGDVGAYLAGPGALVITFRNISDPLLALGGELDPDRRLDLCRSIAGELNANVDPTSLFEAAAGIPDPPVAGMALNERTARSRVLVACGAGDDAAVADALATAVAADQHFRQMAGLK